jgi:cobalamin biosynthesis protein CobW
LNEINPIAERAGFPPGNAGDAALVPWLLDARPRTDRVGTTHHEHPHHAHQLTTATYVDDAPLVGPALLLAIDALGERLVRAKGFVHLDGENRRGIVQRAGGRTTLAFDRAWNDEPRVTRLVLIGEDLDEGALRRQLWACRATV